MRRRGAQKTFLVTGINHGSTVLAETMDEAKAIFQRHYDYEPVIEVKVKPNAFML